MAGKFHRDAKEIRWISQIGVGKFLIYGEISSASPHRLLEQGIIHGY